MHIRKGKLLSTLDPLQVRQACTYRDNRGQRRRPTWRDAPRGRQYYPSHNIAPGSYTPVMLSHKHFAGAGEVTVGRVLMPMQWGLVPSWHRGDPKSVMYNMNNCRSDGMLQKKSFKGPLERGRRCVVLADGFFEWKRDKSEKQPYYIYFPQPSSEQLDSLKCDVKTEIKQEIKSEVTDDVKQEVKGDIKQEVKGEVKQEVTGGVKQEVKGDIKQEVKGEVKQEVTGGVKQEVKGDIKQDVKGEVNQEVADGVKEEVKNEVEEVNGGGKQEVKVDIKQEVKGGSTDGTDVNKEGENGSHFEDDEVDDWKGRRLLTMAGVFDVWKPADSAEPLYSYSIITVDASPAVSWIHDRMPAMLTNEEEIGQWLEYGEVPLRKAVAVIRPVECLQTHPVSTLVNNSRNKSPDCVKPVDLTKKAKPSASSAFMMNWLSKGKKESPVKKSDEAPPLKKMKLEAV